MTVEVGPDSQKYQAHKQLLEFHSDYYRAALNGKWTEAEETIRLEDVEPGIFDIFIDWIYTQKLPATGDEWKAVAKESAKSVYGFESRHMAQIKTYVLADRFMAAVFRKVVGNNIVNANSLMPPWYEVVIYAYSNLRSEDMMLRFLVDTHCAYCGDDPPGEVKLYPEPPHEFLVSVMIRYRERKTGTCSTHVDRCSYHEHSSEEEKAECQKRKDQSAV